MIVNVFLFINGKMKPHLLLKKFNNSYFKSKGNLENLSFEFTVAKKLKISNKVIIKAINKFKPLKHRQEIVFSKNRIILWSW